MRTREFTPHVGDLQAGDLAHAQATAAGEADKDQVEGGVIRAGSLGVQIDEDQGQFAAGDDFGGVDGNSRKKQPDDFFRKM